MELANPASRRQSQQKEDLPSELTKRTRGEGHGERTEHGTDPKEESEKRKQGAPSEKSEEGPEERSERKAQEERNGKHHSTWSGKKQWRRKRETRNGEDMEEKTQSSGLKDEKQSAHDDDTRHGIQTTSPGNLPMWTLFSSRQADEPLLKRIRRSGRIARNTKCSQTKHVEVLVKVMEVELSEKIPPLRK